MQKLIHTFAFGDIHGFNQPLEALLNAIKPTPDDTLIFLGDLIDRGKDSKGVLDTLLAYQKICNLILIQGNHEEMMFGAVHEKEYFKYWLKFGGVETLQSFGLPATLQGLKDVPFKYFKLLKSALPYYETDNYIFTHATPLPDVPMAQQSDDGLRWRFIPKGGQVPHISGKTIICGHSAQKSGKVYQSPNLICIDTDSHGGGYLTALEVETMTVWQVGSQANDVVLSEICLNKKE